MTARTPPQRGRRQARRIATEEKLVAAVGTVLLRAGVDGLGVNAIANEAGVDKKLIYRYFGGLPGLMRAFGERGDFWPDVDELLGPDREVLALGDLAAIGAEVLARHARGLRRRPITLHLLAWECVRRNALTTVLEEIRQDRSEALGRAFAEAGFALGRDAQVLSTLLAAAINYLAVRGRELVVFGDARLDDPGWAEIEATIGRTFAALLASEIDGP